MPSSENAEAAGARPEPGSRRWLLAGLLAALAGVLLLNLALGSVNIPLGNLVRIVLGGEPDRPVWKDIFLSVRLPRALTAILAGAALAVGGLQMQTLFRNPLAGPFVLGINAGASLGVALVVLGAGAASTAGLLARLGPLGHIGVVIGSTAGSAIVLGLVLIISRRVESTTTLLILGLMFGYATNALVSVLLHFSIAERIHTYITWTFGSFGGVTYEHMMVLVPTVMVGLLISYAQMKPLNALLMGEAYAQSMGLSVPRARFWVLSSASILTGAVTAFCGPIGFLGIAVPHLCRSLLNTSDHRVLLPAVTMMGALLALLADLFARMPGTETTLPLNAVTSLIGAPVVTWVVLKQRNLRSSFAG